MKVGVNIPNDGPEPSKHGLVEMAAAAEEHGAESLWVSDHLLMVDSGDADYPFSPDGKPSWPLDGDYYEALISLAAISTRTRRARLGTAVLVLPQRNVLEVAKMAATLDQLSGGRLVLGLGAGWSQAEFGALGFSYPDRGSRMDEMIDALRACWTGRPAAYNGQQIRVPANVILHPRPARAGGPPLLVGGTSSTALRRAGRRGDGWLGIAFAPHWDAGSLAASLGTVLAEWSAASRPGQPWNILKLHGDDATWEEMPALVREADELGFDEVAVDLPWARGTGPACALLRTIVAAADRGERGQAAAKKCDRNSLSADGPVDERSAIPREGF
jgi:probable F420-dependent oxidoreductase